MGAVGIPQHLHAITADFNNNEVASGIERDARRTLELAGACPLAADGADVRAIAAAQHLNTMVAVLGYDKVTLAVKRDSIREGELSVDQTWRIIASSAPRK